MFRLSIPNRTLTLNPSPNPNSDKNVRSTKRHRNKIQHSVIYKNYYIINIIFVGQGVGIQKAHNRETIQHSVI